MPDVHSTITLGGGGATGSDAGVADANLADVALSHAAAVIGFFFSTTIIAVFVALVLVTIGEPARPGPRG